ncbi:cytochrome P450 4C1-like [Pieris napi]|uniref:cytochrome P450 4C1-like n=1 Tax=Pieris napi TaxID=78633 RepID=UPI001FBBE7DB|nr:cytochrome P450 4C1-like [Pieris napi]
MLVPVVLFLIILALIDLYYRFNYKGRLFAKIPGPTQWPIIGRSWSIVLPPDQLFSFSRSLYNKYGPVVGLNALDYRYINIYHPEDIEIILSNTKYNEKDEPYTYLKPWLREGLLISNGLKWRKRRKMLTQAFHFNILRKYAVTFVEQTDAFLNKVQAEAGKDMNLISLITMSTLEIMCETTMGTSLSVDIETMTSKYFKAIHEIGDIFFDRTCKVWLRIDWVFNLTKTGKLLNKIVKDLHKFTMKIIHERKANFKNNLDDSNTKKGRLAMLDLLLQNEKDGNIDVDGIREEVDTFLFEGHDTTASALCFLILEIANDTTVQNKIYDELTHIFGDSNRAPTMDDLAEMKYLECCIKESLRLYPSVPMISRYIRKEMQFSNGCRIPAETVCIICVYDVHRLPNLYPEPEKFIPERFLPENSDHRHPFAYIPFSAGPRNCIGQKFAMLEIKTLISGLIRRFHVDPVTKTTDIRYKCDLVLRTTHPLYVKFRNREQK